MRKPATVQEFLGRHMAACRTLAGLSQKAMAERLKVKQPYVAQLEKGQWVNVDPEKLLEYVKIGLNVSLALKDWLEGEGQDEEIGTALAGAAELMN